MAIIIYSFVFIVYLSFFLISANAVNIKRKIIKKGDICLTERPKRLKMTKKNIKKNIAYQGLNQKEYDFSLFGIDNKVSPIPKIKRIKIVNNE